MTAQPGVTQGQLVLDNNAPPVSTDANGHARLASPVLHAPAPEGPTREFDV